MLRNNTTSRYSRIGNPIIPILLAILFLTASCHTKLSQDIEVEELQCRNLTNPEGVDFPLLSWKISSSLVGVTQSAWQIEIASSEDILQKGKADIWKSGKQQIGRASCRERV